MIQLFENTEFTSKVQASVDINTTGVIYLWDNVIVYTTFLRNKICVYLFTKNREEAENFLNLVKVPKINEERKNIYSFLVKSADSGIVEKKINVR
jgi:hypothetical protein